jgi:hypothetical protein
MIESLTSGFRIAVREKRIVLIFYLINLLFALVVMLPVRSAVSSFAGGTFSGEGLASHLDMDFLSEFIHANGTVLPATVIALLAAATVYWLVNLFLSGGAYATFFGGAEQGQQSFWGDAGRYFGRFFRLGLWSVVVFGLLYAIQFVVPVILPLIYGSDPYQSVVWWGNWISSGIGLLCIILYFIIIDYAKLHIVASGERRTIKALLEGIRFAFGHIGTTFGIALLLFVTGILALLVYNPVSDALHSPSWTVVLLLFVVQQFYILGRMLLRVTLYGSQAAYFRSAGITRQ